MKNKIPMKYRIIFIILMMPIVVIPLISLLTPYNLMENPLISYGMVFSELCALGIGIYGMYIVSKLHRKGETTK